jgi:hypothetical protein
MKNRHPLQTSLPHFISRLFYYPFPLLPNPVRDCRLVEQRLPAASAHAVRYANKWEAGGIPNGMPVLNRYRFFYRASIPNGMKHLISLFLFIFIFMFQLTYSQSKITDIVWVGANKEYLQILKKEAALKKGDYFQEFNVVKYVENKSIILSCQHISGYFEQKYNTKKMSNF